MKAWMLSLIGAVILIAIAELLLPSGKLKNSVRGVFGLIVMLVVIKPLPGIRNADWSFAFDLEQNESFLETINMKKQRALENGGAELLKENGVENASVSLIGAWKDGSFEIVSVLVSGELTDAAKAALANYYGIDGGLITKYA